MARLVILGAGIAGHTAALHAHNRLKGRHEVVVVSPNRTWNWIPSNIWVGTGFMKPEQVTFELAPVYRKCGITFHQAKAVSLHPAGDERDRRPYVRIESTAEGKPNVCENIPYDYLINATGPKLNFEATPGLGPAKNSLSVCTAAHAAQAAASLDALVVELQKGARKTVLIGTGHGNCTCQGAAFEYLLNVEYELRKRGVRDRCDLFWISNEYAPGDFGMGGMHIKRGGYITNSKIFTESLFAERGIRWITQAHVKEVGPQEVTYENLLGETHTLQCDFKMLLPPFSGVDLQAYDSQGQEITQKMFAANKFMLVDADYTSKPYEQWSPTDWPSLYQSPAYANVYAVGIAFAPPHPLSKPMKNPGGTPIFPTPPRTGMPSAVMARQVAFNICDMMTGKADRPTRTASLAHMGAACIASTGTGMFSGSAVSMTLFPIVPDFDRYPDTGRDLTFTTGEIGLAGHWIKHSLHHAFLYKAKAKPFWQLVPE